VENKLKKFIEENYFEEIVDEYRSEFECIMSRDNYHLKDKIKIAKNLDDFILVAEDIKYELKISGEEDIVDYLSIILQYREEALKVNSDFKREDYNF